MKEIFNCKKKPRSFQNICIQDVMKNKYTINENSMYYCA